MSIDKAEVMQQELDTFWQTFGKFNKMALERKEQWSNSSMADMPHWDRVLVEYVMALESKVDDLQAEMEEIKSFIVPAPGTVQE